MCEEPIDVEWKAAPLSDPVERVARALCRHDQRNPDLMVQSGSKEPVIGEDGITALQPVIIPA